MTAGQRIREAGAAAVYARVSTEAQQGLDKTSLDRQEKNCRKTSARLGFTVCEEYVVKEAHSASDSDDRPGLERLYEGAAKGRFRYVLMDVIDRTTRAGPFDLAHICKRFLDSGVEPVWAGHPNLDLTTRRGQTEAAKLAIQAIEDKETIFRRLWGGKTERMEDGLLIRNHIDYGYKWNAERPLIGDEDYRTEWLPNEEGDPSPADVVRRIFAALAESWRTGGDASTNRIAQRLQYEGVPPPSEIKGRQREAGRRKGETPQWRFSIIAYIVGNPTYKGRHPQNRWVKVPYTAEENEAFEARTGRKRKTRLKSVERPEEEWKYANVPALVDERTWEDANRQLERNRHDAHRAPVRYSAADALLYGGHVRCAVCGYAMQVYRTDESKSWTYRCWHYRPGNAHPGLFNSVLAREVDAFVWSEARRIIRDPDYLCSRLAQGKREVWPPEARIAHYARLIADCDAKIDGLNRELAALGGDPLLATTRTYLVDQIKSAARGRQEYAVKQSAAESELVRREEERERLAEFQEKAMERAESLDDLSPEERRRILLDMHPMVRIAPRDDTKRPRIELVFCLTPEAAAHLQEGELWTTINTSTKRGHDATFVEERELSVPPDGSADFTDVDVLDFTDGGGYTHRDDLQKDAADLPYNPSWRAVTSSQTARDTRRRLR